MRLTIIVIDRSVYKDGLCYDNLNFSVCGIPSDVYALQWQASSGWIEFTDNRENQQITQLPAWADACVVKWNERDYEEKHPPEPPAPTSEQIIAQNEVKAKFLLSQSDWTQLPDIILTNKTDWQIYRSFLREIAINPTLDPVWPIQPLVIWQS
jgi:hypothetical protein